MTFNLSIFFVTRTNVLRFSLQQAEACAFTHAFFSLSVTIFFPEIKQYSLYRTSVCIKMMSHFLCCLQQRTFFSVWKSDFTRNGSIYRNTVNKSFSEQKFLLS